MAQPGFGLAALPPNQSNSNFLSTINFGAEVRILKSLRGVKLSWFRLSDAEPIYKSEAPRPKVERSPKAEIRNPRAMVFAESFGLTLTPTASLITAQRKALGMPM